MRKFIVSVVVALLVVCGSRFYVYKANNVSETYENKETLNNNLLSMMLETSAGSGEYQETTASAWPTEGYVFNESLSKCEQGSNLSWDNVNKKVIMEGSRADKCFVYFDVKPPEYLAEHIKSLYTTQGVNNLYLHDSTLTNGAGDNSYRYAGSSETTNNFVCFGYDSTDGTCPTDYLYRIIGVFDGKVKLIKYDYATSDLLGTDGEYYKTYKANFETYGGESKGNNLTSSLGCYYWNNSRGFNSWGESQMNTINLNKNYINYISERWASKILIYKWIIGGNSRVNLKLNTSEVYQNEIISPMTNTTYSTKIALIYASDYGFAASPNAWLTKLSSYSVSSITETNWMYMGLYEHLLTKLSDSTEEILSISKSGDVEKEFVSDCEAIRPTFYLNSDVTYISGKGTKTEPFIID